MVAVGHLEAIFTLHAATLDWSDVSARLAAGDVT